MKRTVMMLAWSLMAGACGGVGHSHGASEQAACTPGSCGSGAYCGDDAHCKSIAEECDQPNACRCQIVNLTGQLTDDPAAVTQLLPSQAVWKPEVVVTTQSGRSLPNQDFVLSVDGDTQRSFAIHGAQVTATPRPGQAMLVARMGRRVSCRISIKNIGEPPQGQVRFFIFDQRTGKPISGARVTLDTKGQAEAAANTDADGMTLSPSAVSGPYTVTVFAQPYHYLTIVGLDPAMGADVSLPLAPRQVARGGFAGMIDFEPYERVAYGLPVMPLQAAWAGASVPLRQWLDRLHVTNNALQADLAGSLSEPCQVETNPLCYTLSAANSSQTRLLPAGMVLSKTVFIKDHFDLATSSGRHTPWAIGGGFPDAVFDDVPALAVQAYHGASGAFPKFVQRVVSLLPKLAVGNHSPLQLPPVDADTWSQQVAQRDFTSRPIVADVPRLSAEHGGPLMLSQALNRVTLMPVPRFPDETQLDTVILLHGVDAKGAGFVPLGLGLGMDAIDDGVLCNRSDDPHCPSPPPVYDGTVAAMTLCDETCAPGLPRHVPSGHVALFHNAPFGSVEAEAPLTMALALSLKDFRMAEDTFTMAGLLAKGPPSVRSFVDRAYLAPPQPSTFVQRTYALTDGPGDVRWLRFELANQRQWHVYAAGGAPVFVAPPVPKEPGWEDFSPGVTVIDTALQTDGTTLSAWTRPTGQGLGQFAEHVQAFSLRVWGLEMSPTLP